MQALGQQCYYGRHGYQNSKDNHQYLEIIFKFNKVASK